LASLVVSIVVVIAEVFLYYRTTMTRHFNSSSAVVFRGDRENGESNEKIPLVSRNTSMMI
jgi:hypothetical protein